MFWGMSWALCVREAEGKETGQVPGAELHWAQANADVALLLAEVVLDGGSVPPPPPITGAKSQEPLRTLLAPRYHVGEVLHNPAHVSFVDVREKTLVNRGIVIVFEGPPGGPCQALNVSLAVEGENGNMRKYLLFLEALPKRGRKRRRRGLRLRSRRLRRGRFHRNNWKLDKKE